MALAIMNCHGYKPMNPPLLINRQEKDILMLDYLGLKFKVSELNANKITSLLSHFFMNKYDLHAGDEYDELPVYKAVEAISSEFKSRTNKLIKPSTPEGEKMVEHSVLIGERACPIAKGFARTAHEQFRAMKNELVSCKLLPYKIVKTGVFAPSSSKIIQDSRPLFHSKSFKIVKNLYDKYYSLSQDDLILGHYIMFKKIRVEISGNTIRFIELETDTAPYQFDEEGYVRISKSDIIRELREKFPDCNLITLTDLTCNSCSDDPDNEELYRVPRAECEGSEPGEGGGSRRRTVHRKRKSHRKSKSKRIHQTRRKHTRKHRHSRRRR
jgi:hypothetical protein